MDADLVDGIVNKDSILINGELYEVDRKSDITNIHKRYIANLETATHELHRIFMGGISPDTIISLELTTNQKVINYLMRVFANYYEIILFDLIQSWRNIYGIHISDIEGV